MDAFHRLLQLSTTVKERASPIWKLASAHQLGRVWLWLTVPRDPVDWKGTLAKAGTWLQLRTIASRVTAGVVFIALLVVVLPRVWEAYSTHLPAIIPLGPGIGGAIVAWAALTQAATARRRHEEQTGVDRQRRITESFSKAVEQLGSDKLEVRLGGIYSLERISKESPDDYGTAMENLTAFVRERSQRNERERTAIGLEERISKRAYFLWEENDRPLGQIRQKAEELEKLGEPPATDIAAVLTGIKRRREQSRERESVNGWRLDLSGAVLKKAHLVDAHLEGASLWRAHLEGAVLTEAHLEGANLVDARLECDLAWKKDPV